jgi:hypothetical protein
MAKYRKKPVVVDAWHVIDLLALVNQGGIDALPKSFLEPSIVLWTFKRDCIIIPTLEGDMRAGLDDMIIRGVAGEFYPCKRDIFFATYEIEKSTG